MNPGWQDRRVRLVATLAFFTLFAGQFWRNLIGWWGFALVAALILAALVAWLVKNRPEWTWRRSPHSAVWFVGLATISIAWSFYPLASLLGIAVMLVTAASGVALGLLLSWADFLRTLAGAFRWILGLSLVFELWVGIFVRGPVLPNFFDAPEGKIPLAFYWSRGLLFGGGPIEGIVASRNLLGMVALLALIVFAIQVYARTISRVSGIIWITVAAATFLLTRSGTVILTAVLVAAALGFALWARRAEARRRTMYVTAAGTGIVAVGAFIFSWPAVLTVLGKSEDVTGRFDIWNAVVDLWAQRPLAGWGYIGYWQPWVEPFTNLAERKGVVYLQAHNAWLDVAMQLGIIGLLVFAALVLSTLWRSWFLAVDRPHNDSGLTERFASSMLPLLLMAALIGQSLGESRLLIEGGFALLIVLAVMTKRRQFLSETMP